MPFLCFWHTFPIPFLYSPHTLFIHSSYTLHMKLIRNSYTIHTLSIHYPCFIPGLDMLLRLDLYRNTISNNILTKCAFDYFVWKFFLNSNYSDYQRKRRDWNNLLTTHLEILFGVIFKNCFLWEKLLLARTRPLQQKLPHRLERFRKWWYHVTFPVY